MDRFTHIVYLWVDLGKDLLGQPSEISSWHEVAM